MGLTEDCHLSSTPVIDSIKNHHPTSKPSNHTDVDQQMARTTSDNWADIGYEQGDCAQRKLQTAWVWDNQLAGELKSLQHKVCRPHE